MYSLFLSARPKIVRITPDFLNLRFSNLYISKVVLGDFLKAVSSMFQNSVNDTAKAFTREIFEQEQFFPSLPNAKNKIERSFLSASARLIPLNFFFSSLIRFLRRLCMKSKRFCSFSTLSVSHSLGPELELAFLVPPVR